jgi:hypothetical protein
MGLLKDFKNYRHAKRNKKYDISEIESFLNSINLETLKPILSSNQYQNPNTNNKFAVYSTYCGPTSNRTFKGKQIKSDIKHFFISNNHEILATASKFGWTPFFLDIPVYDNVVFSAYQAKVAKALPHLFQFLNQYDYTMYLDDKLYFDDKLLTSYETLLNNANAAIGLREHDFLNSNVLAEFAESMLQKRYYVLKDRTIRYIDEQLSKGQSLKSDKLYWTSAIFRNMKHPKIREINEVWFQNIIDCGINCQISFDILAHSYKDIVSLPNKIHE